MAKFNSPQRYTTGLAAAAFSILALAGCASASTGQSSGSPGNTPVNAFEHVHGLGADPLTGNTYAATHHGVWLIPTGPLPDTYLEGTPRGPGVEPVQIARLAQDTMGFTVAAPGHLLASGHPSPGQQTDLNLPNLGLISSTDGAESWTALSLEGETDFHDLVAVPLDETLRIYGYDAGAGTILVSDDSGATWSNGAVLALRDLTASPSRPDRVFATTADGLAMSVDVGRTFRLVAGAPALLLVDAVDDAAGGGLVGIDASGAVWSEDGTSGTWTRGGTTNGPPEAFAFVGGSSPWILVADASGIAASDDYGVTWTELVSMAD
ncbi:F510_1955 family glycosylhydrolase [Cryobacterium roopkundense]|uniref:Exo-alpha-sialidase n=1 Tax=Cryobacterium roopkundense TaxID=1001240 RepID=A0A7W8ZVQ7_9MICO|nr:hypothetical protein [Cryobacterium roopkundense]MBB5641084.1 hypothetical protein [Cryobacterium roopkundense]